MSDEDSPFAFTLRLWGGWLGGTNTIEVHSLSSPRYESTVERGVNFLVPGVAAGFSAGPTPSNYFFLDTDLTFSYGAGKINRKELRATSPDYVPITSEANYTEGLSVFTLRNRIGIGSKPIGIYVLLPLIGGFCSATTGDQFEAVGFNLIGGGIDLHNKLVLAEISYMLAEGNQPNLDDSSTIQSSKGGALWEVRVGLDLWQLFSAPKSKAPQPPPSEPSLSEPPESPSPPEPQQRVIPHDTAPPNKSIALPPLPPELPMAKIEEKKISINQQIHFEFDSSEIKPDSEPILNAVAGLLIQHSEILRIQIQGHTDDVGTDQYNFLLSQRRAEAVRNYLIKKGIQSERLEAVGFGRTKPLLPGTTEAARAGNRRTEFIIVEQ